MKNYAATSAELINLINIDLKDIFKFNLSKHSSSIEGLLNLLDSTIKRQETNFELITKQNTMDKAHSTLRGLNKETPKMKKMKHREEIFKTGMNDGSGFSGIEKKDRNKHRIELDNKLKKGKSASTEYKDSNEKYKLEKSKEKRSSLSEADSDMKKIHKYSKNFEIAEIGGSKNRKGYFIVQTEEDDLDKNSSKQLCLLEKDANIKELNTESATKHKKSKKRHKDSSLLETETTPVKSKKSESKTDYLESINKPKVPKKRDKHSSLSETDREDGQVKKDEDVSTVQLDDVELGDQRPKKKKKEHKDDTHSTAIGDIIHLEHYNVKKKKHKKIKDSEDLTVIEDKDAKSNLENQKQRDQYPSLSQTDIVHKEDNQTKKHKQKKDENVSTVQIADIELGDQTPKKKKKKHKDDTHSTANEDINNLEHYNVKKKKHKKIKDFQDLTVIEDKDAKSNLENQKQRDQDPSLSQTDIEHKEDNQTKKHKQKKDEDVSTVQIADIELGDQTPKKKKKKHKDDTHSTANEDIINLEHYNVKKKKINDSEDLNVIEDKDAKSNLENQKQRDQYPSLSQSGIEHKEDKQTKKHKQKKDEDVSTVQIDDVELGDQRPKKKSHKDDNHSTANEDIIRLEHYNVKKKKIKDSEDLTVIEDKGSKSNLENEKERHSSIIIKEEKDNNDTMDVINETFETSIQLSEEDIQTLVNLQVFIPWDVPRSHKIETRVSSCPTKVQQQSFKDLDIHMKTGPYTKEEDNKIRENWLQFCKEHDLQPNPLLFFSQKITKQNILNAKQRLNFVRYLGKDLETRTLYSIYTRFQILFRNTKKGRFAPEEDNIILTYSEHSELANRFSVLATVLNRSRECIKKRHEVLVANENKIKWNIKLMEDFIKKLLRITDVKDIEQLKDFSIENQHWKQIEKEMQIPAAKLRLKWISNLYPQLFIQDCNNLYEIRSRLIDKLYDSNKSDRRDINWIEVAQDFPGITAAKLSRMFVDMLAQYVPAPFRNDFRACISYLKEAFKNCRKKSRKIKRLVYADGKLLKAKKK